MKKHYLLVSDFDQTLSFNDSGLALSQMLGISGFQERVADISRLHFVQEGAELAYLLRHDPDFQRVNESDLVEVGRHIRLKRNISLLADLLENGIDGLRFVLIGANQFEPVVSLIVLCSVALLFLALGSYSFSRIQI